MNNALKWFSFHQNNSGGHFVRNDMVDDYVVIQAHSANEANELAERIGIYFNGVEAGTDCDCCGDRWYPCWSAVEATDEPMVYNRLAIHESNTKIHYFKE